MNRNVPLVAKTGLRRNAPLVSDTPLAQRKGLPWGSGPYAGRLALEADVPAVVPLRIARSFPAAFSPKVRGLIHARAGGFCEACGAPLPGGKGQCQHRVARGIGGSRNPLLGSPANGADLCGTPDDKRTCHGKCEARDPEMRRRGFWLWSWEDPLLVPVMLHSPGGSGITVYLTAAGGYAVRPPQGGEVA